jgi:hypothetical protein
VYKVASRTAVGLAGGNDRAVGRVTGNVMG